MTIDNAHVALKKYFGYDVFRPMQAEIIQTVYNKRDALVLMPTGGGKSICYQIPAITINGTAVVVSPLIALMKDQVEGLRANGVAASFINSSMDVNAIRKVENEALDGHLKILYVSPEKIVSQGFQPFLKRLNISLFAIDEAHCISAWGHDFRPEYTQLKFLKSQFAHVPLLALTATADKITRKDIVSQLGLTDPTIYISSFDRPNITLTVMSGQKRLEQIIEFLKKKPNQSGIIYCLSRKGCEDLADKLNAKGFRAGYYHADIPAAQRSKIQEDFINDRLPIICATIAFGMGIDKSNVRFVIHYNLPRNLEGYYQEVGRAGRDGSPAEALLFFSYGDVITYRRMIEENEGEDAPKQLKIAKLERMYEFAEAPVCRRKTVLAYFDESYDQNCGNCDVCLHPPRQFDGTVAAQKALSAIKRSGEKVGMIMLVNILRGSQNREIFDNKYNEIKTYGAGREYSFDEWMYLIMQMLHIGLVEIAYDENSQLRVTSRGEEVLFQNKQVPLALPPDKIIPPVKKEPVSREPRVSRTQQLRDELYNRLVVLRRDLAQQMGMPPYQIFTDTTLTEMAEKRPIADTDLLFISGVGERKLQLYGDAFIGAIRRFVLEKEEEGQRLTGSTYLITWDLYKKGRTVEEIAQLRGISTMSIVSHLATMFERGELIDFRPWVSPEECDLIQGALPLFEEPYQLKEIYAHFNERMDYDKIRWAIADFRRKNRVVNEA